MAFLFVLWSGLGDRPLLFVFLQVGDETPYVVHTFSIILLHLVPVKGREMLGFLTFSLSSRADIHILRRPLTGSRLLPKPAIVATLSYQA